MKKIKLFLSLNHNFEFFRHFSQQSIGGSNRYVKSGVNCVTQKELQFTYPEYSSPFTVSINPNYSQWMDRYCTQWALDNCGAMARFGKYRNKIEKSDCGLFAGVVYPTANWHRCEKLMKWSLIFFICDDYHDISIDSSGHQFNTNPFWGQMLEAIDCLSDDKYYNNDNNWPQFVRAVQQILREIYFDFTPNQINRSVNMIKDYINGNIQEKQWHQNELPNWQDYWNARLGSVGGQMALQLIEYAKDIELKDNEWRHNSIERLNQLVSQQIILINDYYTFRKEVDENEGKFDKMKHSFSILVHKQGMTLQRAVEKVNQLIKEIDVKIVEEINTIESSQELQSKQVFDYIKGVNEFLGGYWRHAVTARRYHGYNFKGVLPVEGLFTYDKNTTIITPMNNKTFEPKWLTTIPINVQKY